MEHSHQRKQGEMVRLTIELSEGIVALQDDLKDQMGIYSRGFIIEQLLGALIPVAQAGDHEVGPSPPSDGLNRQTMTSKSLTMQRVLQILVPLGITALFLPVATAKQPVQPLPKVGGCPLGYNSSGSYCVPSRSGTARGGIEKSGNGCPIGFYSSGAYCLSSPSSNREAIQKQGNSCPLGWFSSGSYCVKSR